MGTWGTGLSSNDTYADIYDSFFDLYNDGLTVDEISKKLIKENQETINDQDDSNNFWFALAKAQWECKQLNQEIFEKVRHIIESGSDLNIWKQLGSDEKDIKKRKAVLDKLLLDLQTEKPKPKARKKKIIRQPVYEKGDCLVFKLDNGNYGGAVVLEAIRDTEYGYNLIASTRINQSAKPKKKDFEDADVLILNYANWELKPNIIWYLPLRHKPIGHLIEKVDTIEVQKKYDKNAIQFGSVADFDIWFIGVANKQFLFEENNPVPSLKQSIRDYTKNRKKWKFWN